MEKLKKVGQYISLTVVYGVVQSILGIPCLYGFAALVFSADVFRPYLADLAKIFIFSSFVHSICIGVLSPLPFAIGQVQDAGLIFFCRMASDISIRMKGEDIKAILATTLVTIALSTALVGLCLVVVGKAKLAQFVTYIPMPVVGGYLAFIGLFCIEAGLSLATGLNINGISTWHFLFQSDRTIILCIPAVASSIILFVVARYFSHIAALPSAICIIPIVFYVLLIIFGVSFEEAREFGWLGSDTSKTNLQSLASLYDLSNVDWSVIPYQLTSWLGVVLVVTFGSTLDIAAVEMGTGIPLDTDQQLVTIGISNFITGCTGGLAGSYIFTQTLLGFRTRFHKRSVALFLAVMELFVFCSSSNPLSFVPLFFFAATIIFIGIDLLVEWLWEVRHKLVMGEYAVLLVTFIVIITYGMDIGFLIGIIAASANFVFTYAVLTPNTGGESVIVSTRLRSRQLRKPDQERSLKEHNGAIRCLELHGTIFFGSAAAVLEDIITACGTLPAFGRVASISDLSKSSSSKSLDELSPLMNDNHSKLALESASDNVKMKSNVKFLILDCRYLNGIDATAARRCCVALVQFAERRAINIAYAGCVEHVLSMLNAHGAIQSPWTRHFDSLYDALDWCETSLIADLALSPNSGFAIFRSTRSMKYMGSLDDIGLEISGDIGSPTVSNNQGAQFLRPELQRAPTLRNVKRLTVAGILSIFLDLPQAEFINMSYIDDYYERREYRPGELVFSLMDDPDFFVIVLEGEVSTYLLQNSTSKKTAPTFHIGACIGYSDYMLMQPRTFFAECVSLPTVVAVFSRFSMDKLLLNNPRVAARILQLIAMQSALELQSIHI